MHRRTFALSGLLSLSIALFAGAAEPPAVDAEASAFLVSPSGTESVSEALAATERDAPSSSTPAFAESDLCRESDSSFTITIGALGCAFGPTCYVASDCDTLCGGAGLGVCAPDWCCWCSAG